MSDERAFEWDAANEEHVREAGIEPGAAEDALRDPDRIGTSAYNLGAEHRWAALGATENGEVLFVVFTRRAGKVRVVTARPATDREKRRYRRRGK